MNTMCYIAFYFFFFFFCYNYKLRTASSSGYCGPLSSFSRGLAYRAKDPLWPMWQRPTAASVRDGIVTLGSSRKLLSILGHHFESSCCTLPELWLCADLNWQQNSALSSLLSQYYLKYWKSLSFPEYRSQGSITGG